MQLIKACLSCANHRQLGDRPEMSQLPNGDLVATISVATTEKWVDKSTGEERERNDWHRITAFRGNAEVIKNYFRKGSQMFVQGAISYDSWEDYTLHKNAIF